MSDYGDVEETEHKEVRVGRVVGDELLCILLMLVVTQVYDILTHITIH
jgi:hypothetical protein